MKTLWSFGDSFTFGFGCRIDGPLCEYYYKYKNEGYDIWPILLASKLDFALRNFGECSASNDYILDTMMKNFDDINEGDIVILGKTLPHRFDIKNHKTGDFYHVTELSEKNNKTKFKDICRNQEETETLVNFLYYFACDPIFKERQDMRFNFMKHRLINERKIEFYHEWMFEEPFVKEIEKIRDHTKNEFDDGHFSFNGHKQMCDYLYQKIQKRLI